LFWIGDTVDLEPGGGATLPPPSRDFDKAPCLPVFQTGSLAESTGRLKAAGVRFVAENVEYPEGKVSWWLDPAGNASGLLEKRGALEPSSWQPAMSDRAGNGWRAPDLVRLCEVVHHCVDVDRITAFYRDVVGLATGAGIDVLTLGEHSALRILPGGAEQPIPNDRYDVIDAFILRVDGVDEVVADIERQGARVINPPFDIEGGRISYLLDPEGQVFGIQTRMETTNRVEDHEAFRRRALP
jgi:predicted enzyme related to lactoylglutathione lyase